MKKLVDFSTFLLYNTYIIKNIEVLFIIMKYWEERKNHYILKTIINIKEYELCDLYLTPFKDGKDYACKICIGECICKDTIQPVFDIFSAHDLEHAKAQAEILVIKQVNKKKDKLESEIYRYDKILNELN